MSQIHFFKAHSRLGLINVPYNSTFLNVGVEDAPDTILDQAFLAKLTNDNTPIKIDGFTFPLPETVNKKDYESILANELKNFSKLIEASLNPDNSETQVVIGGDHSVAFSSVQALLAREKPEDVFYIQFDSHSDLSSFGDSLTGNFHGMFARALYDVNFDSPAFAGIERKLHPAHYMHVGNIEADDFDYINLHKMRQVDLVELRANPEKLKSELSGIVKMYPAIHVSFDIDIFDATLAPATGTPAPNGFSEEDVLPLLNILSSHPNLSIDLVEVNPKKEGALQTIALAQRVLLALLKTDAKK